MKIKYKKILSPAKVNLLLKITGKTDNNYHLLKSIFHTVDLYDIIYIREKDSQTEEDDEFKLILGEKLNQNLSAKEKKKYFSSIDNSKNNIIIKTFNKLRKEYNIKNYEVILEKNIPVGAGLGGGSSNSAQILNYVIKNENINITNNKKTEIAKSIGADVPFFLAGGCCFVEGIGEKVYQFDYSLNYKLLLIYPKIITSTEKVYKNLKINLTNLSKCYKMNANLLKFNKKELISLIEKMNFSNDLEESCFEIYNEIKHLKNSLVNYGFINVFLSGSGSTLCSIIIEGKEGDALLEDYLSKVKDSNLIFYSANTIKRDFMFEEAILDENY